MTSLLVLHLKWSTLVHHWTRSMLLPLATPPAAPSTIPTARPCPGNQPRWLPITVPHLRHSEQTSLIVAAPARISVLIASRAKFVARRIIQTDGQYGQLVWMMNHLSPVSAPALIALCLSLYQTALRRINFSTRALFPEPVDRGGWPN